LTAQALHAFISDDKSDLGHVGALFVSEFIHDVHAIRMMLENIYKSLPKK